MNHRTGIRTGAASALVLALMCASIPASAQDAPSTATSAAAASPRASDWETPLVASTSELRDLVARYSSDRQALQRRWNVAYSTSRRDRMREFYESWQGRLDRVGQMDLGVEGSIDYVLLQNDLRYRLQRLEREAETFAGMAALLPFSGPIADLVEERYAMQPIDPERSAALLDSLIASVETVQEQLEASLEEDGGSSAGGSIAPPAKIDAFRAAGVVEDLGESLDEWYEFYAGYDPLFTWWVEEPYTRAAEELGLYQDFLREKIVEIEPEGDEPIVGDPIGPEAIDIDLAHEMLAYSAKGLIEIAEREYAWCVDQLKQVAGELGYGDDWHAALEHVKSLHLEPGEQPQLVRELALEAVEFIEARDLVTVPPLAKEIWRMNMLSPERQKTAPFFLGGEVVQVAFPTDEMTQEQKLMSLRSNNVHFSRAVVHHELIPGHHLQGFMTSRYNTHRRAFGTPFWGEGWALYWEMRLWDLGFPTTPEDRMGMLFWRTHRAARIIFSLKFHLGEMTADEAIDFLVDGVGHERSAATAEVRRSFNGSYPPLYQAAYMIGGLQILALHDEVVGSGRMSEKEFHDAMLKGGSMPIEMHRARLTRTAPEWEFTPKWKFASE
jgi:uncharacterized protein (DUF885 family)